MVAVVLLLSSSKPSKQMLEIENSDKFDQSINSLKKFLRDQMLLLNGTNYRSSSSQAQSPSPGSPNSSANTSSTSGSAAAKSPAFLLTVDNSITSIESILYPSIMVGGTLGNIMSIIVLRRLCPCSVYTYLAAMCLSDTLIILLGTIRDILALRFNIEIRGAWFCRLHVFAFYTSCYVSSWTRVALNVDRFVAVQFPTKFKQWCSTTNAFRYIATITISFVAVNLHLFYFVGHASNDAVNNFVYRQCRLHPNYGHFFYIFYSWIDCLLQTLIPFLIMIICCVRVIACLWNRKIQTVTRKSTAIRVGCLMMIGTSVVFLLFTLPVTAYLIYYNANFESIEGPSRTQWSLFNLMMYLMYGCNLFTYCLTGRDFRNAFVAIFRLRSQLANNSNQNNNRRILVPINLNKPNQNPNSSSSPITNNNNNNDT